MSVGFTDLIVAIGLAVALEGAVYALFPDRMKKMLLQVLAMPPSTLRAGGVLAAVTGVVIVWMVRG
ncbi:MAG: DUF2065 domain-containing protein [Rhodospirillales bacterium]